MSRQYGQFKIKGTTDNYFVAIALSGQRWKLNLNRHEFQCKEWQVTGLPCAHAVSALIPMRHLWIDYCSKYHRVSSYVATEKHPIHVVDDSSEWGMITLYLDSIMFFFCKGCFILRLPQDVRKGRGRGRSDTVEFSMGGRSGNVQSGRGGRSGNAQSGRGGRRGATATTTQSRRGASTTTTATTGKGGINNTSATRRGRSRTASSGRGTTATQAGRGVNNVGPSVRATSTVKDRGKAPFQPPRSTAKNSNISTQGS
ncbi:hypothetical protein GIB67_008174 [Kingdonia uniflora]|uniref:Zinc finger PMZ-type domain-containing protein n=1 Tax=Kingdonia uniflora TaxID=39325 RepID=A0A7J7LUT2_9MAGN|nr:hypothetical protein GIB67_008174 [Kingdonia uniflora]